MSKRSLIREFENTFEFMQSEYNQDIYPDLINIMKEYLFPDLYSLWQNFFAEKEQQYDLLHEDCVQDFKELFLKVLKNSLKLLEKDEKDRDPQTFSGFMEILAILLGKKSTQREVEFDLCDYLRRSDNLHRTNDFGTIIIGLEALELFKNTLLILPENHMHQVFRLNQKEQSLLLYLLEEDPQYLSDLRLGLEKNFNGIYARKDGYICWEQDILKLVFLNCREIDNKFLYPILNKIPQFINDQKVIQDRQLAPMNLLNSLELLPSPLNGIVAQYYGNYHADLAASLLKQLKYLIKKYPKLDCLLFYPHILDLFKKALEGVINDCFVKYIWDPYEHLGGRTFKH